MHHDVVEIMTGDLTYPVKHHNKDTESAWDIIEEQIVMYLDDYKQYTDKAIKDSLDNDQLFLFKACDILDLYIFCYEEQNIGNTSPKIDEVLNNCVNILGSLPIKYKSIDNFLKSLSEC